VRIRPEPLFDLWQRERPQVFIGDPRPDPDLWRYMASGDGFVEVRPNLWVDKLLASSVALAAQ
jgi:hypothetical protein